jgi:hypothetical protein
MRKYDEIKSWPSNKFKRLTGVSKMVFQKMATIIRTAEKSKAEKGGRPSHLNTEDKLLMTLEYLREYRTYFHLGQSYGLCESACYRNCRWVEDVLIRDKTFALPGKKELLKGDSSIEVILVDATETPIERPKKTSATQAKSEAQKQQTKGILFWEKEKAYIKKPSHCL